MAVRKRQPIRRSAFPGEPAGPRLRLDPPDGLPRPDSWFRLPVANRPCHMLSLASMDEYSKLLDKLQRIEALHAGATTPGERIAAADALRRITERVRSLERTEQPVEYQFSLNNTWSRKLFLALLRRYGFRPYRYPRQRWNTVMVRIPPSFVDQLWPEFVASRQGAVANTSTRWPRRSSPKPSQETRPRLKKSPSSFRGRSSVPRRGTMSNRELLLNGLAEFARSALWKSRG